MMQQEKQLELGPVERLDDAMVQAPVPQDEPAAEGEAEWAPPMMDLEESDELIAPLAGGPIQLFPAKADEFVPPSVEQLEGAADVYTLAGAGMARGPIRADEVYDALTSANPQQNVNALVSGLQQEDREVQQMAAMELLGDPTQAIASRLEAVKAMQEDDGFDANIVQRAAMHNLATAAWLQDNSEDAQDAYEVAADRAEGLPRDATSVVDVEDGYTPAQYEQAFRGLLDMYVKETNENFNMSFGSAADVASAALVPLRFQAPVVMIYNNIMPADKPLPVDAKNVVLLGEAIASIRDHLNSASPDEKLAALQSMMRTLKPNSGLMAEGNDMVTLHVLNQVFADVLHASDASTTQKMLAGALNASDAAKGLPGSGAIGAMGALAETKGFNRLVDNVGSILDLALVGALAKSTLKLGVKLLPKSLRRAADVNPDVANKMAADLISDPQLRAKMGGMSVEEVMHAVFPSAAPAAQHGGINGLGELVSRSLDVREAALRTARTPNLSATERADAVKELTEQLGEVAARPSSTLHLDKTVFQDVGGDVEITALFGRDKAKGWSSLGNARKAMMDEAKEVFGEDVPLTVVAKHPKTGKLVEVGKGVPDRQIGEFYIQAKDVRSYDSAPTTFHELQFGQNSLFNAPVGRWANKLSLGFANPTNVLGKQITDAMSHVKGMQTRWQTLALDLTKDIHSLNKGQQANLSTILKQGEKVNTATGRGKTFDVAELRKMNADDATIKAYYQTRVMSDIMYDVANRQTRIAYQRQGMKAVHGPTGRVGFGKPLRQQDAISDISTANGRRDIDVFDPVTGTLTRLTSDDIAATYKEGGSLVRLTTPVVTKRGHAAHVLVDPAAGSRVREIPRQVLTKVEGYYPHVWEGNFVVYGRTSDGQKVALGLATNEVDAAKAAQRRQKALQARKAKGAKNSTWTEFSYELDRSLQDIGVRGMMMEDMYTNMGGLVYGQRNGGRLANFSKADGDILVDPVESYLRAMDVVGYSVTKEQLTNNLSQRLMNFIRSENLQLQNPRELPHPKDNPVLPHQAKQAEVEKAMAAMEQIEFYKRTPDAIDQVLSRWFNGASHLLTRLHDKATVGKGFLKWVTKQAGKQAADPTRPDAAIYAFMHRYSIAAAPVRHLALGVTQSLMNFGLSPRAYGTALSQSVPVLNMLFHEATRLAGRTAGGKHVDGLYKASAKLTPGMTAEELRAFVRVVYDSGITSSTAHHNQMRQSMRSLAMDRMQQGGSKAGRTAQETLAAGVRAADDVTYGNMSRMGFELGENINRVITALVQYNRDKEKGIANLAQPDYVRHLVGQVNEITGNMTAEMGFQFQRGFFKNFVQFWGFQIKMLHNMLPAVAGGSRTLSSSDKWRIAIGQFLLFGRRGGAHFDTIHRFVDMKMAEAQAENPESTLVEAWRNPVTQAAFQGMVFDWTLNKALQMAAGPDTAQYALSDSFAPGGGTGFVVDALTDMASEPDFVGLAGLSGEKASKVAQYLSKVRDITLAQVRDLDNVPLDERMAELSKEGVGQLFSQYDRYLAARAAEQLDGWVGGGGAITESYSGALEGTLFHVFGIMTQDRSKLYEDMDTLMLGHAKEPEKMLDKLADQYYRNFITYATKLDSETEGRDDMFANMMSKWTRNQGLLFASLPPEEAEVVQQKVADRIGRLLKDRESTEHRFVNRIVADVAAGQYGPDGPGILQYLHNQPYVKDNPVLLGTIDRAMIEATTETD